MTPEQETVAHHLLAASGELMAAYMIATVLGLADVAATIRELSMRVAGAISATSRAEREVKCPCDRCAGRRTADKVATESAS